MPSEVRNTASRTNFDTAFCGSIPLNFINQVQPHGVLLVLQKESLNILQASENTLQHLNVAAEDLLDHPLLEYIREARNEEVISKLQRWGLSRHFPLRFLWKAGAEEKLLQALVHAREEYLLLELEAVLPREQSNSFMRIYQDISYGITALKGAGSLEELGKVATTELKKLSGFDRVMLYKFDQDWNGTVIAEEMERGMTPYLGLRFPASDVPKPARDLYFRTPYRTIPDVQAAAVKLYPVVNPQTNSLTDISDCILRGVPLVHTEYLQNMGVAASMSTPIIVDNRLWGLISCHHRQPKAIDFEIRSSFEIISGIISAQLSAREKEESYEYRAALHKTELKILEQLYASNTLEEALFTHPGYLFDLFDVGGMVLIMGNSYEKRGEVPDQAMVKKLVKWLTRYAREKIFTTDSLPLIFEDAGQYRDMASGLIALQITVGKNYLLGFRPEVIRSVAWGGNPHEAIRFEEDKKRYHPRNSFNIWKEQVEYSSSPWLPEPLEVAGNIRTAMLEKLIREKEV